METRALLIKNMNILEQECEKFVISLTVGIRQEKAREFFEKSLDTHAFCDTEYMICQLDLNGGGRSNLKGH
jgi:hypothetical protein